MLVLIGKLALAACLCVVFLSISFVVFLLPRFLVPFLSLHPFLLFPTPSSPFPFLIFPCPFRSLSFPFPLSFPLLFLSLCSFFPFPFPLLSLSLALFPYSSLPFPFRSATFPTRSLDDNVQPSLPDCLAAPAPLPGAARLFTFTGVAACT